MALPLYAFPVVTKRIVSRPHPLVSLQTEGLVLVLIGVCRAPMVLTASEFVCPLSAYFGDTKTSLLLVRRRLYWRLCLYCPLQDTVVSLCAIPTTAATAIGKGHYAASVCLVTLGRF